MTVKNPLICPVCGETLLIGEKTVSCIKGHSFDRSREGGVNLVLNGKKTSGDGADMITARKSFLSGGYYDSLANALYNTILTHIKPGNNVLDVCCGEGYFTGNLAKKLPEANFYGFDLSVRAIRYAAKAADNVTYFVANAASIPFCDGGADIVLHVFAPVIEDELIRVMRKGGVFIHVFPGSKHLWQLKTILYPEPRENDENPGVNNCFSFISSEKIKDKITVSGDALRNLITMTPYFHKSPPDRLEKALERKEQLTTETEFIVNIYTNRES